MDITERRIQIAKALTACRVRRALQSHRIEPGIYYVNGQPTDAINMDEARKVLREEREHIVYEIKHECVPTRS